MVGRHSIFRTALHFDDINGCLNQTVLPSSGDMEQYYTLVISSIRNDEELEKLVKDEMGNITHFNLGKAQVLRVHLIEFNGQKQILLFNIHHCAFDGYSCDLFIRDFVQIYRKVKGLSYSLTCLPEIDFINYSVKERAMDLSEALRFWEEELSGYPFDKEIALPYDFENSLDTQSFTVSDAMHDFELSQEASEAIVKFAEKPNVTLYIVGLTSFYLFLHMLTEDNDICVQALFANRYSSELESIIGVFSNTLPCRVKFDYRSRWTFKQLLREVKDRFFNIMQYSYFPYSELVQLHRRNACCPHLKAPFIAELFALTTSSDDDKFTLDDFGTQLIKEETNFENWTMEDFEISMNHNKSNNSISFWLNHSLNSYKAETGNILGQCFQNLLERLFHPSINLAYDEEIFRKINLVLPHEVTLFNQFTNIHKDVSPFIWTSTSQTQVENFQKISLITKEQSLSFAELCYHTSIASTDDNIPLASRLEYLIQLLKKAITINRFLDNSCYLKVIDANQNSIVVDTIVFLILGFRR